MYFFLTRKKSKMAVKLFYCTIKFKLSNIPILLSVMVKQIHKLKL